jgi:hypothetical protein
MQFPEMTRAVIGGWAYFDQMVKEFPRGEDTTTPTEPASPVLSPDQLRQRLNLPSVEPSGKGSGYERPTVVTRTAHWIDMRRLASRGTQVLYLLGRLRPARGQGRCGSGSGSGNGCLGAIGLVSC